MHLPIKRNKLLSNAFSALPVTQHLIFLANGMLSIASKHKEISVSPSVDKILAIYGINCIATHSRVNKYTMATQMII